MRSVPAVSLSRPASLVMPSHGFGHIGPVHPAVPQAASDPTAVLSGWWPALTSGRSVLGQWTRVRREARTPGAARHLAWRKHQDRERGVGGRRCRLNEPQRGVSTRSPTARSDADPRQPAALAGVAAVERSSLDCVRSSPGHGHRRVTGWPLRRVRGRGWPREGGEVLSSSSI